VVEYAKNCAHLGLGEERSDRGSAFPAERDTYYSGKSGKNA
jgi:hypothetical protein